MYCFVCLLTFRYGFMARGLMIQDSGRGQSITLSWPGNWSLSPEDPKKWLTLWELQHVPSNSYGTMWTDWMDEWGKFRANLALRRSKNYGKMEEKWKKGRRKNYEKQKFIMTFWIYLRTKWRTKWRVKIMMNLQTIWKTNWGPNRRQHFV